MEKALSTLFKLTVRLGDMRDELGESWPRFVNQLQAQKTRFENLSDKAALDQSVDDLLRLFITNEKARKILTRPDTSKIEADGEKQPQPGIKKTRHLSNIHNKFYLFWNLTEETAKDPKILADCFCQFCQNPGKVTEQNWPKPPPGSTTNA